MEDMQVWDEEIYLNMQVFKVKQEMCSTYTLKKLTYIK